MYDDMGDEINWDRLDYIDSQTGVLKDSVVGKLQSISNKSMSEYSMEDREFVSYLEKYEDKAGNNIFQLLMNYYKKQDESIGKLPDLQAFYPFFGMQARDMNERNQGITPLGAILMSQLDDVVIKDLMCDFLQMGANLTAALQEQEAKNTLIRILSKNPKFELEIMASLVLGNPGNFEGESAIIYQFKGSTRGQLPNDEIEYLASLNVEGETVLHHIVKNNTPITKAALTEKNFAPIILAFAKKGFDFNSQDKNNKSILDYAISNRYTEIVSSILEHGKLDLDSKTKVLRYAAKNGVLDIMRNSQLSECVNLRGAIGRTALMEAAAAGNMQSIKALMQLHSDINAKSVTGKTPLMYAAIYGNVDAAKLLIELDADVHIKNEKANNMTAMDYAMAAGDKGAEVVNVLESANAQKKFSHEDLEERNQFTNLQIALICVGVVALSMAIALAAFFASNIIINIMKHRGSAADADYNMYTVANSGVDSGSLYSSIAYNNSQHHHNAQYNINNDIMQQNSSLADLSFHLYRQACYGDMPWKQFVDEVSSVIYHG